MCRPRQKTALHWLAGVHGTPVTGPRALRRALFELGGRDIEVEIARGGKREIVVVTVEEHR